MTALLTSDQGRWALKEPLLFKSRREAPGDGRGSRRGARLRVGSWPMGGGEPADERREGPMALPGRGEIRTRRGAEVTAGAEGWRREAERQPG